MSQNAAQTTHTRRIALTGGIASGKTAASDYFASLGVPVIDTDNIARELVTPGQDALAQIQKRFGPDFLTPEGTLNRAQLRDHIFTHPEDKAWLEALLHPLILQRVEDEVAQLTTPYCVVVIPLLVESTPHLIPQFERVLLIDAPESRQISRLCARDNMHPAEARHLLSQQASRAERQAIADDCILNDGSLAALQQAVKAYWQKYLANA